MSQQLANWWDARSRRAKIVLVICAALALVVLGASLAEPEEGTAPTARAATQPETLTVTVERSPSPPPPLPERTTFIVSEIVDGDTIRLANGKKVRLAQIDAPELRNSECYADAARSDLEELLPTREARVRLEFDPRLDKIDRYGRQLAYVFIGRKNVNLAMVRRGGASVWFFNGQRGKYAGRLMLAARQARAAGRGVWSACSATRLDPTRAINALTPPPPPPPPPAPAPEPASALAQPASCHPSYEGACLDPNVSDYDCEGGSGNGPSYTHYVTVVGPDEYGLDADGDGSGCED